MKIRSLDQLVQFLDEELAWRKRELTTLKFMLAKLRKHERVLLLRAAVCVLYAHWEGFVKAAATSYISFVATRGLRYCDMTPNFVALGLRQEILQAGRSKKPSVHTTLTAKLMLGLTERSDLDWESAVDTHSNLNAETLSEIFCLLGLDSRDYLLKRQLVDRRLIANRNLVAHGSRVEIEPDDYSVLHDEIIKLVQKFRTDVENAAATEDFVVTTLRGITSRQVV